MKAWRWSTCLGIALLLLAACCEAAILEPRQAEFIVADDALPPDAADSRWRTVRLPDEQRAQVVWYRIEFDRPRTASAKLWAVYLPYLYGGGKVWLDGDLVTVVQEANGQQRVRWERPHLLPLPISSTLAGHHVLQLRVVGTEDSTLTRMPRLTIGPQADLQPAFDRRFFWVRTVPWITVVAGCGIGLFFLVVWWRRRGEKLYGLFGLALLLWAVRTNTFVLDVLPASWWSSWRLVYHASTGGFVIMMALFALALAGWYRRRIAVALLVYWLIGPIVFVLAGARGDDLIGRYWTAGLIPIGVALVVLSGIAAWRQRTGATIALACALALATATGFHDYLLAFSSPWLHWMAPEWRDQRVFLLHHGANVLLIVMVSLLSSRFVRTLRDVEDTNRTLEARVAEREQEIATSYEKIARLQRHQATIDERQRIMQDLHDGLGSQLLVSLLQVERGALAPAGIANMLRACIADMRLAIEALGSDDEDFRSALGNFKFRWESQLREAGILSTWQIETPDMSLAIPPHMALQVLRVLQEALTNALRHGKADHVSVRLTQTSESITLDIEDNGCGFANAAASHGRGLANMKARAVRMGARLEIRTQPGATCITLVLPVAHLR